MKNKKRNLVATGKPGKVRVRGLFGLKKELAEYNDRTEISGILNDAGGFHEDDHSFEPLSEGGYMKRKIRSAQ